MYSVCQSSFYDFDTYFGLKTKSIYRLDREKIKYGTSSKQELLDQITQHEGGKEFIISTPDNIECKNCSHVFQPPKPDTEGFEEEKSIYAV